MLNKLKNIKELIKAVLIYRLFPPYLNTPDTKVNRVIYPDLTLTIKSRIINLIVLIIIYCIGLYTVLYRNDTSIHNTNFLVLLILFISTIYFLSITSIFITIKIFKIASKRAKTSTLDEPRDA